jgi:hypothetical protein
MACENPSAPEAENAIRSTLGARNGALLPNVGVATIQACFRYLAGHLSVPFEARYCSDDGSVYAVTVAGLADPQAMSCDDWTGLRCVAHCRNQPGLLPLVDIEAQQHDPNFRFLEDYRSWLWKWRESHAHRPAKPR